MSTVGAAEWTGTGFRHEALLYRSSAEFLDRVTSFLADGVQRGEPVLAIVSLAKTAALRDRLGSAAEHVEFADVHDLGQNPARIIPLWQRFLEDHATHGRPVRGVGEPAWRGRSAAATSECHRHEALLNVAFDGVWPFWLLCPYDVSGLAPDVVDDAVGNHPVVQRRGTAEVNPRYDAEGMASHRLYEPLPEPPQDHLSLVFEDGDLSAVRAVVTDVAASAGVPPARADDLLVAVNELATNSLRHGGGQGVLRSWPQDRTLVIEVQDRGELAQPLAGRREPETSRRDGRGLWLANQLCDLVQIRSLPDRLVVRVHTSLDT